MPQQRAMMVSTCRNGSSTGAVEKKRSANWYNIAELWRQFRRFIVFAAGVTVLLVGVLLVFLPGPAILVIPAGLAILATEFTWARRLLLKLRQAARRVLKRNNARSCQKGPTGGDVPANTSRAHTNVSKRDFIRDSRAL